MSAPNKIQIWLRKDEVETVLAVLDHVTDRLADRTSSAVNATDRFGITLAGKAVADVRAKISAAYTKAYPPLSKIVQRKTEAQP